MADREQVRRAVFDALEEVRLLSMDDDPGDANESSALVGPDAVLDSMGFVNFIVAVEERLASVTSKAVNVGDLLHSSSTVGELIDQLSGLVDAARPS